MKTKSLTFFSMVAGLFLLSIPVFAHHGYAAYDMQVTKTLKATITSFSIMNPHSQMTADVTDEKGNVEHWVIEGGVPPKMLHVSGWERDSLKAGDQVTIFYHPVKGEGHAGLFIRLVFPDGHVLPPPGRRGSDQNNPDQ
jgi:hypothetical protein